MTKTKAILLLVALSATVGMITSPQVLADPFPHTKQPAVASVESALGTTAKVVWTFPGLSVHTDNGILNYPNPTGKNGDVNKGWEIEIDADSTSFDINSLDFPKIYLNQELREYTMTNLIPGKNYCLQVDSLWKTTGYGGNHIDSNTVCWTQGGQPSTAEPPTVKVYKVVINNQGNPTPSTESFGLSINGGSTLSNGTMVTLQANTPATLSEAGHTGYEFVEIRGDGHCPENLGGTITLDAGQHIECYIVNQPINPDVAPEPGVIFHYNTLSFSFADRNYGDSCSAPGKTPPCIELANSGDGNVLVVDSELQTDTTIVLFSVVETDKVTQNPPQFATSPICVLSGVGPHTIDYAQDVDNSPVVNPSGQMGFEFQCSLVEADNFKVSYALIETQTQ